MRTLLASLIVSNLIVGSALACDHSCSKSDEKKCGKKQEVSENQKANSTEMKASLRIAKERESKSSNIGRHGQSALAREKILK